MANLTVKNWNPNVETVHASFGVSNEEMIILKDVICSMIKPLEDVLEEAFENKSIITEESFKDLILKMDDMRCARPNVSEIIYEVVSAMVDAGHEEHPGQYVVAGLNMDSFAKHDETLKHNLKVIYSQHVHKKDESKEELIEKLKGLVANSLTQD